MKNHLTAAAAGLLLALSACNKEGLSSAPPAGQTSGFKTYLIPKGQHYATNNPLTALETNHLRFTVKFDSSAVYQTVDPENQYDINKLYGFSDNGALHHAFSARVGWRWSDGALRLFAYTYNDGTREERELTEAAIGKEIECAISVNAEGYVFSADGHTATMPRKSKTPKAKGYRLYPYFGGNESAPHDVRIAVREGAGSY